LARGAHAADLLIVGIPADPFLDADRRADVGGLIMQAERLLLSVPDDIEQPAIAQIVVAWSIPARRAARSVMRCRC